MKLSIYFYLAFVVCSTSIADENLLELNAENLTQLALKNSTEKVLNEYALHILKTQKIKEYFKYRKDSEKLNELIQRERKLIDESLQSISKKAKYIYKVKVNYHSYDDKKSVINLGNNFAGTKQSIFRAYDQLKGLPSYFILLIPNLEIQNSIKIIQKNFDRRQRYLRKTSQINNKGVYVEYILSLEKYQNQQSFQTVIEKISIYTSDNKKSLLGVQKETRDHKRLINDWLLSDGFTNPLIGIHAFQFSHHRLQDPLDINSKTSQICKKTKKIGIHQVVVCSKHFSDNTKLLVSYLGGKIAQIDLVAVDKVETSEAKLIQSNINTYLKLSKLSVDYNVAKWEDHSVTFLLFSDAFKQKKTARSDYKSIFEVEGTKTKGTLILSMMAHDTKKLLVELGINL